MTEFQKVIKYIAIALAVALIVSIIGGIVGGISAIVAIFDRPSDSELIGEMTTQELPVSIGRIEIDLSATELKIQSGDTPSLQTNHKNLRVTQTPGYLTVSEKQKLHHYPDGLVLIITLPADHILTSFELDMGAGRVTIDSLTADIVDMDLGAGEVNIHNLNARKFADIDGGAGQLTIKSGLVRDLDLDMGVGELRLECGLVGQCDLDLGVGSTYITLPVSLENYTVRIDKGLGTVTLDGKPVGSGTYGIDGGHTIDISGGIGSIDIGFIQE